MEALDVTDRSAVILGIRENTRQSFARIGAIWGLSAGAATRACERARERKLRRDHAARLRDEQPDRTLWPLLALELRPGTMRALSRQGICYVFELLARPRDLPGIREIGHAGHQEIMDAMRKWCPREYREWA